MKPDEIQVGKTYEGKDGERRLVTHVFPVDNKETRWCVIWSNPAWLDFRGRKSRCGRFTFCRWAKGEVRK